MRLVKVAAIACALALSPAARATDVVAPVTQVYPQLWAGAESVSFNLGGLSDCSGWLSYHAHGAPDQVKAYLGLITGALLSGHRVHVSYSPSTCQATYISLTNG